MKYAWSLFVVAIFVLLLSQAFWLYNAYIIQKEEIVDNLNITLKEAVGKELDARFLYSEQKAKEQPERPKKVFRFALDSSEIEEAGIISQQEVAMQQLMLFEDIHFDLSALDSIYKSMLVQKGIQVKHAVYYRDSTQTLDYRGKEALSGVSSINIPIVNRREIQAIFAITAPLVLKEMLGILIVSMLMLLLIVACLVYEMRVIFTQRRLARLRDDFSHALIHDMKTPLGTIYMAVDQWGKGNLDTKPELRTKFCETAMAQVLGLQALVDKILTIARMEQNKLTLERRITDVPAMIDGLVDKFKVQVRKSVRFEVDIQMEDCSVVADPIYLQNAISNVIDNAIKYSGNSVEIHILCRSEGEQLFIEIADNGFGISTNDQQKIFEKFERGAAVWRKGAKGFGLGLNYVKRVMEAHGGTVSLCSLEGEGSKFILYIPLKMVAI